MSREDAQWAMAQAGTNVGPELPLGSDGDPCRDTVTGEGPFLQIVGYRGQNLGGEGQCDKHV